MIPAIAYNPRVLKTFRKIVAILLLGLLPLQSTAAVLSHMLCAQETGVAQVLDGGHSHDGTAGGSQNHTHDDTDSGNASSSHLSCHLTASGIPSLTVAPTTDISWVYRPAAPVAVLLFFPEQPQRVPLA